ncbi:MAG: T9SS type A sorting domain-containing protein, partial [Candidatus Kapaibacterium sp.]
WGLIRPSFTGAKSYNWNLLGIKPTPNAEIKVEALGEASGTVSTSDPFPIVNQQSGAVNVSLQESFALSVNPQPLRKSQQLKLNLKFDSYSGVDISMFDLSGKKVLSKERVYFGAGDNSVVLEPGSLSAGSYILEVRRDNGEVRVMSIVIE